MAINSKTPLRVWERKGKLYVYTNRRIEVWEA